MIRPKAGQNPSPAVTRLDGGVVRITHPLPLGIDHVHSYLVPSDDGLLLVDTGLGLPGAEERWAGVFADAGTPERIFVTHFHPDHVGGAEPAAAVSGAAVLEGSLDYEYCLRVWGSTTGGEREQDHLERHGMPGEEAGQVLAHQLRLAQAVRFVRDPEPVEPGDVVGGWDVVHLPGHADGHLALHRDGVLVAGDALLSGITPNVGLWPGSSPDPLGDYLGSLRQIEELAPVVALPGHGERILDPAGRAQEIAEHHRVRLRNAREALEGSARTAYAVSLELFPDALSPPLRRFALVETLAHLEYLALHEEVERLDGDVVSYRPAS
jgi:glyoxylase-like metal-dependent hydrolase (beta-lactamase superfamily II)